MMSLATSKFSGLKKPIKKATVIRFLLQFADTQYRRLEIWQTARRGCNMKPITLNDFSKFGYRERKLAEQLLNAWNERGLPEGFCADEVTIISNTLSGSVFLSNSEYQAAMMNGDKLEIFYTDFRTGEEGFKNELSQEALINLGLAEPSEAVEKIHSIVDSAEMGYNERRSIEYFLTAWNDDNLPEKFSREGVRLVNQDGSIFLTNAENQTASLDGYDVKLYHIDPETGEEVFDE